MLTKVTLDWNCVIAVEENRPEAGHVRDLVSDHRDGKCEVALLAASASENAKSKRFPGNARLFTERVAALGWTDLPLVPMPAVIGLSYIDFSYIVCDGDAYKRDISKLWQVIAPKIDPLIINHLPAEVKLDDEMFQSEALFKWRNAWCDVVSAYSHIHDGRDLFVTTNVRDFQKNAERLRELGINHICIPSEARGVIASLF